MEIAIIGGGASGLFAATAAKNDDTQVTIYEKENRVGRKLLATGNGRCNMTNLRAMPMNYHGRDVGFVMGAMNRFWVRDTLEKFEEMGVLWKEEDNGKVYPYSDTASSVLDVLRRRVDELGVRVECGFAVGSIRKTKDGFTITSADGEERHCDRVIIATGGKAGSTLGSDGSGYALLQTFGHKLTALSPSLVQIKTETELVRKLKGIKVKARVTIGDKSEVGELLFTDYGISGPPVFSLSSYLDRDEYVSIDLMPEYELETVNEMLCSRCGYLYDVTLEEFFVGMLNKRVGQAVLKHVGIAPLSRKVSTLTADEIRSIAEDIKCLRLSITGTASWNNAQVTKGGIDVGDFRSATMESKLAKGVYACGEVLDIDGDCGGYNLQWAWSSGYLAGLNAGKIVKAGKGGKQK